MSVSKAAILADITLYFMVDNLLFQSTWLSFVKRSGDFAADDRNWVKTNDTGVRCFSSTWWPF